MVAPEAEAGVAGLVDPTGAPSRNSKSRLGVEVDRPANSPAPSPASWSTPAEAVTSSRLALEDGVGAGERRAPRQRLMTRG